MSESVCTDYGRIVKVEPIRTFHGGCSLGVGFDEQPPSHSAWFVFDRVKDGQWSKHCGPYSTRDQAVWWIEQIKESQP